MDYKPWLNLDGQSGPGLAGMIWGYRAPHGWLFHGTMKIIMDGQVMGLAVMERTEAIQSNVTHNIPTGTILAGCAGIILSHYEHGYGWKMIKKPYGMCNDGDILTFSEVEKSHSHVLKNYRNPKARGHIRKYRPVDSD